MTVTDEQVAELRRHVDDAELVELTYAIVLENTARGSTTR